MRQHAQAKADVEVMLRRIAEGAGYIERRESIVERTIERGLDPSEAQKHLDEMKAAQVAFCERRDRLLRIVAGDELPDKE